MVMVLFSNWCRAKNASWTESVLYSFTGGTDGAYPFASLIFDAAGNLYGTTSGGGVGACSNAYTSGCGVVFELTPNLDGTWDENVMHSFMGGAERSPTRSPLDSRYIRESLWHNRRWRFAPLGMLRPVLWLQLR